VKRIGLPGFFSGYSGETFVKRSTNVVLRQLDRAPGNFASEAMRVLTEQCDLSPGTLPRLQNHLDEVILNALTHSESPVGAFVGGQGFPTNRRVDVAILDLGVTIRGHLSRNPRYGSFTNDAQAIIAATKEGVTGTVGLNKWNEPNSGAGLTELREYAEQGHCELAVLSGGGLVVFGADHQPNDLGFRGRFPGCLVNVRFHMS